MHRGGGSLTLNVHLHAVAADGVWSRWRTRFHEAASRVAGAAVRDVTYRVLNRQLLAKGHVSTAQTERKLTLKTLKFTVVMLAAKALVACGDVDDDTSGSSSSRSNGTTSTSAVSRCVSTCTAEAQRYQTQCRSTGSQTACACGAIATSNCYVRNRCYREAGLPTNLTLSQIRSTCQSAQGTLRAVGNSGACGGCL